jgi:two-component system phosphate regulon sensor histidine kinase PhoR
LTFVATQYMVDATARALDFSARRAKGSGWRMAPRHTHHRLLSVIAVLSVPAVGAFATLVASGDVAIWPAVVGVILAAVLVGFLIRPYSADLADLTHYVRDLARGEASGVAAPEMRTELVGEVLIGISQLRRGWRAENERLATLVGFHSVLFDNLPGALFLLNAQRRIVRANLAAGKIFGRQLQGRDLASVLRNPLVLDAAEQVIGGQPGCDVEFTLAGQTEQSFRAMVEPLPQPGADGSVAVVSLHDVTTLKRMELMRADFVANASHELRTPLATLLGFIETLRGAARDDADARERFLAIMHDQASRMSRLVADLLNLSRIELNERTPPVGKADIAAVVRRVAEGLELQAAKRRMYFELELAEGLPPVVGREDELEQIFQNLLDNALKYGREGSPVVVTAAVANQLPAALAERAKRAIAVSVKDRGEGIAREHLPRLTERFFRVDTARSRRLGGTGLGLAIVKHLVNRHRGWLAVDSVLGEGSTFTVYLPVSEG